MINNGLKSTTKTEQRYFNKPLRLRSCFVDRAETDSALTLLWPWRFPSQLTLTHTHLHTHAHTHTHTHTHTHDGCRTIASTRAKRYKADCSDSNTSTQSANRNHAERGIQRDTEREKWGVAGNGRCGRRTDRVKYHFLTHFFLFRRLEIKKSLPNTSKAMLEVLRSNIWCRWSDENSKIDLSAEDDLSWHPARWERSHVQNYCKWITVHNWFRVY